MSTVRATLSVLIGAALCSCTQRPEVAAPVEITTADYQLVVPPAPKATLILFPCFSCDAADTRSESKITAEASANDIAVLMMNFNQRLFLSHEERTALLDMIAAAIADHHLNAEHVFIGGFSSGGNMAVLLAREIERNRDRRIGLKGLFVVDSPLDLAQLYPIWKRHAEQSTVPSSRGEGAMVIAMLDSTLGNPTDSAANYEVYSPVTTSLASVSLLKDLAVRLYTEPDTAWWRINRGDRYEDLNACYLEKLHAQLQTAGCAKAEFIATKDRGIQHGHRHPHAWSIVEEKDLVRWILEAR